MRRLVWSFLILGMMALQGPVFASAKPGLSCDAIYREEKDQTIASSLNPFEIYLREKNFTFADPARQGWIGRFRTRSLFKKLDLGYLNMPRYREWWVEKMVDLEVSRKLDLLSDYELNLNPSERKKVNRLLLRSVINEGLRNNGLSVYSGDPKNFPALLMRTIQIIRFNPLFRFVIKWEIPGKKRINFTDEQIEILLTKGLSSLETDPVLKSVVEQNKAFVTKAQMIFWAKTVLQVGWTVMSLIHVYPEVEKAMLDAQIKQQQQMTETVTETISQSRVEADGAILDLASNQLRELFAAYEAKYRAKPTEEDKKLLEDHVCRNRYGSALGEAGIAQCLLIF